MGYASHGDGALGSAGFYMYYPRAQPQLGEASRGQPLSSNSIGSLRKSALSKP